MGNKSMLFKGIVFSGLAFVINYLIIFFLTPFITNNIGTDAYGYVTLAKTFALYALILMTALNSYASRFIAVEYHKGNLSKANGYFNSVFFSNLVVSIAIFVLVAINVSKIQELINTPQIISRDVSILFLLIFANFIITNTGTSFQVAAYIKNKIDLMNIFRGLSYIIEAIVLFTLYSVYKPLVYYVGVGLCMSSLVLLFGNIYISKRYTPELRIKYKYFNVNYVKKLVVNGIWNSFNSLGNTLNSGLDLLICSIFLDPISLGQLSIAKSFVSIFSGIFQMTSTPFHPLFLKSYADRNYQKLKDQFVYSIKISGFISNLGFAGFLALGMKFFRLWIPEQNIALVYNLTVLSILSCTLDGAIFPLFYIYTLKVKNKIPSMVTIAAGILNVLGMLFLISFTNLGVYSIVITTVVIMLIIEGITNPIYMSYCMGWNASVIYKPLVKHITSCVIMSCVFVKLSSYIDLSDWGSLIIFAFILIFIGALIHFVTVFGPSECMNKFCGIFKKSRVV